MYDIWSQIASSLLSRAKNISRLSLKTATTTSTEATKVTKRLKATKQYIPDVHIYSSAHFMQPITVS